MSSFTLLVGKMTWTVSADRVHTADFADVPLSSAGFVTIVALSESVSTHSNAV